MLILSETIVKAMSDDDKDILYYALESSLATLYSKVRSIPMTDNRVFVSSTTPLEILNVCVKLISVGIYLNISAIGHPCSICSFSN